MNMADYMQNPLGKGASVLMLSSTRKVLDEEYAKIASLISHTWYNLQNKYYIAHVKIPSKSSDKMYYDVLIEIDIDSLPKQVTMINNGKCRVFSNCPSFVFTYAYVFNKNNDIIPWTKKKYNRKVFEVNPAKRNPAEIKNYERSIYFAIKYITSNGRNYKAGINLNQTKIRSHYQILSNLQSSDEVLEAYRYQKSKEEEIEKKDTKKPKRPFKPPTRNTKGKTKTVKSTNKVKTVKSTSKLKKI